MIEERKFKIQEIKKYQAELSDTKQALVISCLVIGSLALLQYLSYYRGYDSSLTEKYGYIIAYVMNSKNLANSISKKPKIQKKIDELIEDFGPLYEQCLEEYNQDVSMGRGR